jgi:hypothetical protein
MQNGGRRKVKNVKKGSDQGNLEILVTHLSAITAHLLAKLHTYQFILDC